LGQAQLPRLNLKSRYRYNEIAETTIAADVTSTTATIKSGTRMLNFMASPLLCIIGDIAKNLNGWEFQHGFSGHNYFFWKWV
jgi:hypothetical protein